MAHRCHTNEDTAWGSDEEPLPAQDLFAAHRAAREAAAASAAHAGVAAGDQRDLHCAHHAHVAVPARHAWRPLALLMPPAPRSLLLLVRDVNNGLVCITCRSSRGQTTLITTCSTQSSPPALVARTGAWRDGQSLT